MKKETKLCNKSMNTCYSTMLNVRGQKNILITHVRDEIMCNSLSEDA